ncbi:MAG: ornithine cyclodeaminase [Maritimibacter sp.]
MSIEIIPAEAESLLDWRELTDALLAGHRMPRAELGDTFLYREPDTMLSRSAWIDGMGMAVKTATVFPDNRADNLPMVNGAVNLYSDDHARFMVWNRSSAGAEAMAANYPNTVVATDLESGVMASDIVTSATMARAPLIMGEWLQPGQHIDLIGAYRPDMREADDVALTRARVFVDSRETVLNHIGELKIPLEAGVISRDHVAGDFYDIESGAFTREAEDITLFKNGGGAHLDLITSRYILDKWRNR